jgi:hypothetical protein
MFGNNIWPNISAETRKIVFVGLLIKSLLNFLTFESKIVMDTKHEEQQIDRW